MSGSPFGSGHQPNAAAVDPSNSYLYVANGIDSNIWTYRIGAAGGLTPGGSPTPAGTGPVAMATVTVNGPALGIAATPAGTFTQAEADAVYSVSVTNSGAGSTWGAISVGERVPTGLTLVSMAGDGWTCPEGGVICTRSDALTAGASYPVISVTMNVAANAPATVTNVLSVSGEREVMAPALLRQSCNYPF